jgi:hypothetical protein
MYWRVTNSACQPDSVSTYVVLYNTDTHACNPLLKLEARWEMLVALQYRILIIKSNGITLTGFETLRELPNRSVL